jgi:2-keto-4-pentenoate hydratase/2-oxohepta-3-ene-1,7-dioic acid hydratase in catechol pathway
VRLVSYRGGFGRIEGSQVVPLGADVVEWLAGSSPVEGEPVELDSLELLAPVPRPGKIVCVGRNYVEHAHERGFEAPPEPILFAKWGNSVVGPDATVAVPPQTEQPDWEAELGVVIGNRCSRVAPDAALACVGGYTCLNDLSARDLQNRVSQWTRGKAIDGFLPMGPALVTPDEIGDPQQLGIRCRVGDETMQDSHTSLMIWPVAELIAFVSETITLEPGDVIASGTPAGIGAARTPPRFLRDGDTVEVEIERIGVLRTTIAAPHLPQSSIGSSSSSTFPSRDSSGKTQ